MTKASSSATDLARSLFQPGLDRLKKAEALCAAEQADALPRICADRDLLASAARRAAAAGLVLASDGRFIQTMREPLPPGWNRVAVTERRPA